MLDRPDACARSKKDRSRTSSPTPAASGTTERQGKRLVDTREEKPFRPCHPSAGWAATFESTAPRGALLSWRPQERASWTTSSTASTAWRSAADQRRQAMGGDRR
jgi:hypothetical protein